MHACPEFSGRNEVEGMSRERTGNLQNARRSTVSQHSGPHRGSELRLQQVGGPAEAPAPAIPGGEALRPGPSTERPSKKSTLNSQIPVVPPWKDGLLFPRGHLLQVPKASAALGSPPPGQLLSSPWPLFESSLLFSHLCQGSPSPSFTA